MTYLNGLRHEKTCFSGFLTINDSTLAHFGTEVAARPYISAKFVFAFA